MKILSWKLNICTRMELSAFRGTNPLATILAHKNNSSNGKNTEWESDHHVI